METIIKIVDKQFVLGTEVFTQISANFFNVNDSIIVYSHDQKVKEFKVKYQRKNAFFEEIFPGKGEQKTLLSSQFDEGDEIRFSDPDKLFIKIISRNMLINVEGGCICAPLFLFIKHLR